MIFSCLVDADFRDTEAFYARTENLVKDREWPTLPKLVEELTEQLDQRLAKMVDEAPDTEVNRLRKVILGMPELRPATRAARSR